MSKLLRIISSRRYDVASRWPFAFGLAVVLACPAIIGQVPTILSQPVSVTVKAGQTATFRIVANGAVSYRWQRNNVVIAGAISSSLSVTAAATDTGEIFNAVVLGPDGQGANTGSAWLHVIPSVTTPSVTAVENFGSAPASQVADSFGLGVDSYQEWQYAAVAAMGGKWVRADGCLWEYVEVQQLPANVSGGFNLDQSPNCAAEVDNAYRHGLHLDNILYWAPPHNQVATITITADVPAGSLTLPFALTSGSIAGHVARDLLLYGTSALRDRIDYGTPVDSSTASSLTLPEPSLAPIPAGTVLTVQVLLYPPVLVEPTATATGYTANPSIQAWTRYVSAVENYMKDRGVTGAVELWNEPEQSNELWDFAPGFYAQVPAHFDIAGSGRYLSFAAAALPAVAGVKVINGWSDVSGSGTLYNPWTLSNLPVAATQLNQVFAADAFHLYSNNPEQFAWLPEVVKADVQKGQQNPVTETPIGGQVGADLKAAPFYDQQPYAAGGLAIAMTEGGIAINQTPDETEDQRTRFNLRQFLTFSGLNIHPVIFFKAGNDKNYEWFGSDAAHTPHPVVAAFTALLADVNLIANAPAAPMLPAGLPQVTGYQGYYPLATASFVGRRTGEATNSVLFFAWQKSYTVPPGGGTDTENYGNGNGSTIADMPFWVTLASPAAVPLQITVPAGLSVKAVLNLVTQRNVPFTQTSASLTFAVTDDPVEVFLIPAPAPAPTATLQVASVAADYGTTWALLGASLAYTGKIAPTGAVSLQLSSGTTLPAVCNGSAGVLSCGADYLASGLGAGSYTVTAILAPDVRFAGATATGTLTIRKGAVTVTIANQTVGYDVTNTVLSASVSFGGIVPPSGAVHFRLDSGITATASCSGTASPLVCFAPYDTTSLSKAKHVLTVTVDADTNFVSATGTGTLTIAALSLSGSSVWVANGADAVSVLAKTGHGYTSSTMIGGGTGLAVDAKGSVWSINSGQSTLTQFSSSAGLLHSGMVLSGVNLPVALTLDGAGFLWVLNGDNTVTAIAPGGTAVNTVPYRSPISVPTSVQVDSFGNLWICNAGDNSLTEMIGVAAPILAAGNVTSASAKP